MADGIEMGIFFNSKCHQNYLLVHGSLGSIEEATSRAEVESSTVNPNENRKFGINSFGTAEYVEVQAVLAARRHPWKQTGRSFIYCVSNI